jgi:SAM-dependent methyltransferase
LAFVERTGCRLTGVDREEVGIAYAQAQVLARGLSGRATFSVLDCEKPLPFEEGGFDAVMCIDAISHLRDRYETLRDWARLLRNGGRLVFTDVAVITGAITKSELDIRVASGPFVFVPPGINEYAIKAAGLTLLRLEDRTTAIVEIGTRMCSARARHAAALKQEEGADGFEKRQRLYATCGGARQELSAVTLPLCCRAILAAWDKPTNGAHAHECPLMAPLGRPAFGVRGPLSALSGHVVGKTLRPRSCQLRKLG